MTRALLYKEWIKLRLWWAVLLLGATAFALYLSLTLRGINEFNDPVAVWNYWIFKGWLFFRRFELVPLVAGAAIGFLQFLPEMQTLRIRLVFHLPLNEERALLGHLLLGAAFYFSCIAPALVIISVSGLVNFPAELQANLLFTATPWVLSGLAAYLFTAAVFLETNWRHRVLHLLIAAAYIKLLHQESGYDAYRRVLLPSALWTLLLVALPLLAGRRFRKGLD